MDAVLLPTSRWPVRFPSGPFCLGSPWISLSFHRSLMSSCSCQHLLTASNSSQHTGSWDPRDELQSAVCRGGFTLSRANQGKHPPSKREGVYRQIEPKLPYNYPATAPLLQAAAYEPSQQRSTHFDDYFPICLTVNNNNLYAYITLIKQNVSPPPNFGWVQSIRHFAMLPKVTVQMSLAAGFDYF